MRDANGQGILPRLSVFSLTIDSSGEFSMQVDVPAIEALKLLVSVVEELRVKAVAEKLESATLTVVRAPLASAR